MAGAADREVNMKRNLAGNEAVVVQYLVLSETVIADMEKDRVFPSSLVTQLRLHARHGPTQNRLLVNYIMNFPGPEAYENFVYMLRATSQSWLSDLLDTGKKLDAHERIDPHLDPHKRPGGNTGSLAYFKLNDLETMLDNSAALPTDSITSLARRGDVDRIYCHPPNINIASHTTKDHIDGLVDIYRERVVRVEKRVAALKQESTSLQHRLQQNLEEQRAAQVELDSLRHFSQEVQRVGQAKRDIDLKAIDTRHSKVNKFL